MAQIEITRDRLEERFEKQKTADCALLRIPSLENQALELESQRVQLLAKISADEENIEKINLKLGKVTEKLDEYRLEVELGSDQLKDIETENENLKGKVNELKISLATETEKLKIETERAKQFQENIENMKSEWINTKSEIDQSLQEIMVRPLYLKGYRLDYMIKSKSSIVPQKLELKLLSSLDMGGDNLSRTNVPSPFSK